MSTPKGLHSSHVFNFLSAFIVLLFCTSTAGVEIIVHPDNPVASLSKKQLKSIFTLRRSTWENGTAIVVVTLSDSHKLHNTFAKRKLSLFPYKLRRIWDRAIFAGMSRAPQTVNSIDEMINRVQSSPGAIGYIEKETGDESIKTLTIQ